MGHIQKIALLIISTIGGSGLSFALQVLFARGFDKYYYGQISSSIAISTIVVPICSLGISQYWLKFFISDFNRASSKNIIKPSINLVAFGYLSFLLILFYLSWIGYYKFGFFGVVISMAFSLSIIIAEMSISVYQIRQNYIGVAFWQIGHHALRFLSVLFIFLYFEDKKFFIPIVFVTVSLIYTGLFFVYPHKFLNYSFGQGRVVDSYFSVIHGAKYFWLAAILHSIYYQGGGVFVGIFLGGADAAAYNSCFTIIGIFYMLPTVLYQRYMTPKLHSLIERDKKKFLQIYKIGFFSSIFLGLFFYLVIKVFSKDILRTVYGDSYIEYWWVLSDMAISMPFVFSAFCCGSVLVTKNNIKSKVYVMAIVAACNFVLNFLMVNNFGVRGVVLGGVLSNILLAIGYFVLVGKFVNKEISCE